ncbi:acyl-CoA dehydrogenase family protein [Novosphingobium piscinae]|uniref:Acyl-CoA/acyl-ACP dehydrogenase n=1 Tax=Novosphingobium piscinae TaxID=1507448 RepID=A0A7X1FVE3_9SPHN|nr:acyl-CoA dehydrogenase family protein [Novosphingobium piscinae]MBC2667690.1 acyl-CoA/acyl-ACP dehydrogenase [Novosphingobium piscinae]
MMISREELRDSARKGLGSDGLAPDPVASWDRLVDMGWFALAVPEELGGLGLGAEALAAVHVELGRALVPGAAIAQMAAIEVLCAAPDFADRAALIPAAVAGERIGLSLDAPGRPATGCVIDADQVRQLLLVSPQRIALAPVLGATMVPTWDETRRLGDVAIGAETVIAAGDAARGLYDLATTRVLLALAADAVGGAAAALAMTVDYLKTRRQFDRPLALFQALKHRVADCQIALVAAEALLWSRAAAPLTVAMAGALKARATTMFRDVAEEAVQLHGGIGLTAEHPCHLFLKRAFLDAALAGDADHWNAVAGQSALALVQPAS